MSNYVALVVKITGTQRSRSSMNTVQRIAKNTAVLLVCDAIAAGLGFFYVMYVARYLGASGFGVLSFAMAIGQVFAIFVDLGLQQLIVREVARDKSLVKKYVANVAALKILLVGVTSAAVTLIINGLGFPQQTAEVVYLISLAMAFNTFTNMFNSIFQAFERMEYMAFGKILNFTMLLTGVLWAASRGMGLTTMAFLYSLAGMVVLVYSLIIYIWKFAWPTLAVDWAFWRSSMRQAWPMGMMLVCVMICFRIDAMMLSWMKGEAAVGIYSAACRLAEASTLIPGVFVRAVFPILSAYYKGSTDLYIKVYEKSVKYMFYLALPMAMVIMLLAGPIINLVYGHDFTSSASPLQVLIWAAAVMYVTMVVGIALVSANMQMLHLALALIAVVLNVLLNLVSIPRYGCMGASATTLATQTYGLLAGIFFLTRYGFRLRVTAICIPALLAVVGAAITGLSLNGAGAGPWVIYPAALLVYFTILYVKGIDADDRRMGWHVLSLFWKERSPERINHKRARMETPRSKVHETIDIRV